MIEEYISALCDILHIQVPYISYETSNFSTVTMMAQCNPQKNTIYIRHTNNPNPDYYYAIAHEVRHLWQYQDDKCLYFSNYSTSDLESIESYNNQLAEVDAHAFATIIMSDFFHLKPLYNGLSEHTIESIHNRIGIILHDLT